MVLVWKGVYIKKEFENGTSSIWTLFLDLLHVHGEQVDSIESVNMAFLNFGMWKTTFPWHVKDKNLYSINYLHEGAPKVWFGISASYKADFEELARSLYAKILLNVRISCVIPLKLLVERGIPYSTMTQRKGEFMITFPGGYHAGFNTGYKIAESTNFGSTKWIKMENAERTVSICSLCHDLPRFDMEAFNDKYESLTCDICQTVFTQERTLRRHKRIHSGEKPFECIECENTLTQRAISYKCIYDRILEKNPLRVKCVMSRSQLKQVCYEVCQPLA